MHLKAVFNTTTINLKAIWKDFNLTLVNLSKMSLSLIAFKKYALINYSCKLWYTVFSVLNAARSVNAGSKTGSCKYAPPPTPHTPTLVYFWCNIVRIWRQVTLLPREGNKTLSWKWHLLIIWRFKQTLACTFSRENTAHKLLLYLALEKKILPIATFTNLRDLSIFHQIKFNTQQVSPLLFY